MHTAIPLSPDLASATRARRLVEWFADELDVDATSALVVATELTTNAVRHGAEPIVMRLRLDGGPWFIEVSDCGASRVPTRSRDPLIGEVEGGMGLVLIARLSLDWGVREAPRGCKTVWAALDVEPRAGAASVDTARGTSGVASPRSTRRRRLADYERRLAAGERKLGKQLGNGEPFDALVAAMHRAAATRHDQAAVLYERLATMADEQVERLFERALVSSAASTYSRHQSG